MCDSKSHAIILWRAISMKLNYGIKIKTEIKVRNKDIKPKKKNQYNQNNAYGGVTLFTGMF